MTAAEDVPPEGDVIASEEVVAPDDVAVPDDVPLPEDVLVPDDVTLPDDVALPEDVAAPDDVALPEDVLLPDDVALPGDVAFPDDVPALDDVPVADDVASVGDVATGDDVSPGDDIAAGDDVSEADTGTVSPVCGDGAPAGGALCFDDGLTRNSEGAVSAVAIARWGEEATVLFAQADAFGLYAVRFNVDGSAYDANIPVSGVGSQIVELAGGDFDADGFGDVAVAGTTTNPALVLGGADGAYLGQYSPNYGEGQIVNISVADIVGTPVSDDIASSNMVGCSQVAITSAGSEAGFFTSLRQVCAPDHVALAQLAEGATSLVLVSGTSLTAAPVGLGPTEVTLGSSTSSATLPASVDALDRGDLTGDGYDELVVLTTSGAVLVLKPDVSGGALVSTSVTIDTYDVGESPGDLAVGDVDGDGDVDVVVTRTSDDSLVVLLNDGGALSATPFPLATGSAPTSVAVGDVNGDGVDDIAVGGAGPSGVVLYRSTP